MRYKKCSSRYTFFMSGSQESLFEELFHKKRRIVVPQTRWYPTSDLYETENALIVTVELAGVRSEDFEITLYENALVIEGERRIVPKDPQGFFHSAEIQQGPFCLVIPLPPNLGIVNFEASYENGLLHISLMKREEKK